MSILIRGMAMPKNCFECPFRLKVDPDTFVCLATNEHIEETFTATIQMRNGGDCPLIELPPHGRLIDADALIEAVPQQTNTDRIRAMSDEELALFLNHVGSEDCRGYDDLLAWLRKMDFMQGLPRYTITYCQYGDVRMKPTDIWTNHPNPSFKPPCRNGDPCHVPAPRGARTGTQGLKGSVERSVIPQKFCEHIVEICETGE